MNKCLICGKSEGMMCYYGKVIICDECNDKKSKNFHINLEKSKKIKEELESAESMFKSLNWDLNFFIKDGKKRAATFCKRKIEKAEKHLQECQDKYIKVENELNEFDEMIEKYNKRQK